MLLISGPLMIRGDLDTKRGPLRILCQLKGHIVHIVGFIGLDQSISVVAQRQTDLKDTFGNPVAIDKLLILQPTASAEMSEMR